MKKVIYSLMFLLPVIFLNFGCKKDDPLPEPEPEPEPELEQITDPRDGQVYWVVNLRGSFWMAENLNYEMEDSWWYNDDPSLGSIYGRLYSWDSAKEACPPGWRLPTHQEITELITFYGTTGQAYEALIEDGGSGFNALLGGWRYPVSGYYGLELGGVYWSGTEIEPQSAWCYEFYSGRLRNGYSYQVYGNSCRCLQD